jgi:hypothetical protein
VTPSGKIGNWICGICFGIDVAVTSHTQGLSGTDGDDVGAVSRVPLERGQQVRERPGVLRTGRGVVVYVSVWLDKLMRLVPYAMAHTIAVGMGYKFDRKFRGIFPTTLDRL